MHSAGMQAHGPAPCFVCGKHGDPSQMPGRYPGTPRQYHGLKADEWPGAERGPASQVADFVTRLRAYLAQ